MGLMGEKVVNIKTDKYDVYIGRGSKWGNPFKIGKDGNRAEVIAKYVDWLEGMLYNDKLNLKELRGKILGCHCKPLACHGDILIDLLYK